MSHVYSRPYEIRYTGSKPKALGSSNMAYTGSLPDQMDQQLPALTVGYSCKAHNMELNFHGNLGMMR